MTGRRILLYVRNRLLGLPFILLGISLLAFVLVRLVPVEPAEVVLRMSNIPPTDEAIASMRQELGTDRPLPVQYADWLWKAVHFDFGTSYVGKNPVWADIREKFPSTLLLAGSATLLSLLVSIPLGVMAAMYKGRAIDQLSRVLSLVGSSMPRYWLAFLLVYAFSVKLDWFPIQGRGGWQHLVLPTVTLSAAHIALFSRLLRSTMLENAKEPYVLYARVRGLSEREIVLRHILPNSLLPLITSVGVSFGYLLGGTVIVEQIFSWPGLGRFLIESIMSRDYPVIQCYVLLMAAVFVLTNLAADVIGRMLDPRLMNGEGGNGS
ncbi:MAG: nickel transporter, permease subunit NikB [Paenibacillus sp.]|jgi:nickel ABC transporter permease subunit NikB|uniref:nickel ABC transporter permease n=1 Tax=Paenibacillus sp. GCM10012303 TaxID=3317340 RepID=UPI0029EEDD90|nr:nickel transporter, permease subunit NikB [Paenibacillus sp.]